MSLIVELFDVALQTKFRDFRQFEVNDLNVNVNLRSVNGLGALVMQTRKTEYHSLSLISSKTIVFVLRL